MGEEGKRSRRARASAVATAIAFAAPILFLGGAIARAAESSSDSPTGLSIGYTDANGQPDATGGPTTKPGTTGNTGSAGASVDQTIAVSILPGSLTITPSTESISFAKTHGQGNGGPMAGSLSTVTVVDARGSLVGWDATVSLQSVDGVSAADLAGAKLCLSPDVVTVVAGNQPEVKSGKHACASAGDALTLFHAPPNGGGGTFADTGSLTLLLPSGLAANAVTATLAVAVH